jgi:NhaP-type Na+/H+ or K+/H+ antiporter
VSVFPSPPAEPDVPCGALVSDGLLGLVRFRLLGAEAKLQPLLPLATGIILYALCHLMHANPYLAAFSAGAVLTAVSPEAKTAFEPLGEALAELAKFAALLVFGALLTPQLFGDLPLGGYIAVLLAIVLIRPASMLISLIGTRFDRRERLVAAWFGPKGFASVVYGLLVLQAGVSQGEQAYTLIAVCIAFSIVAHSSTDVSIARIFHVDDLAGIPGFRTGHRRSDWRRTARRTAMSARDRDLSRRRAARWLTALGAALGVVGAVMYVLPGPGLPVLGTGVLLLLCAAMVRLSGRWRR